MILKFNFQRYVVSFSFFLKSPIRTILHLPDGQCKLFFGLFVQLGKVATQLPGQEQLIVPDGMMFFQIPFM